MMTLEFSWLLSNGNATELIIIWASSRKIKEKFALCVQAFSKNQDQSESEISSIFLKIE